MDSFDWRELRSTSVLYEDDAVLALDKPAGISVTGERHDTDVVRLAAENGERLMPAHRIDKITSGVIVFAKTLDAHGSLARQFNKRTVAKAYVAITTPGGVPETAVIDLPLSVGRKNRVRIAALRDAIRFDESRGRWWVAEADVREGRNSPALTRFSRQFDDGEHAVLLVEPTTGRRHQIRVHLAWVGHGIVGDPLYEKSPDGRTCLHATRLAFDAPWRNDARITIETPPPKEFWYRLVDRGGAALAPDLPSERSVQLEQAEATDATD